MGRGAGRTVGLGGATVCVLDAVAEVVADVVGAGSTEDAVADGGDGSSPLPSTSFLDALSSEVPRPPFTSGLLAKEANARRPPRTRIVGTAPHQMILVFAFWR